mmetsp:Transcript_11907/g.11570  ORF Transcript_11907/g.11570 Transcript_11907/m.11570 type:complete len:210 (+) Transcript_11907:204-833(+)
MSNSTDSKKMSISSDLWKTIIEFLNDEKILCGFGSILPYRAINKTLSNIILESIREVRINILSERNSYCSAKILKILLSRPLSLRSLMISMKVKISDRSVYDLVCGCKELRSLHIYVASADLIGSKELQQIGNNCTKIEVFDLKARNCYIPVGLVYDDILVVLPERLPCFLTSFFNVRRLLLSNCVTVPPTPITMHDWTNLRYIEGGQI